MKKYLLFLIFYLKLTVSVYSNPSVDARTAILIDFHSDEILYEFDPDTQIYPASMTKIMTSIIAFDLLKKNEKIPEA